MNILLVSPATPDTFWSFRHVLPLLRRKSAFPPLGLLTVAAMLPADWRLKLVDLDVTALEDADIDWADWVHALRDDHPHGLLPDGRGAVCRETQVRDRWRPPVHDRS